MREKRAGTLMGSEAEEMAKEATGEWSKGEEDVKKAPVADDGKLAASFG